MSRKKEPKVPMSEDLLEAIRAMLKRANGNKRITYDRMRALFPVDMAGVSYRTFQMQYIVRANGPYKCKYGCGHEALMPPGRGNHERACLRNPDRKSTKKEQARAAKPKTKPKKVRAARPKGGPKPAKRTSEKSRVESASPREVDLRPDPLNLPVEWPEGGMMPRSQAIGLSESFIRSKLAAFFTEAHALIEKHTAEILAGSDTEQ